MLILPQQYTVAFGTEYMVIATLQAAPPPYGREFDTPHVYPLDIGEALPGARTVQGVHDGGERRLEFSPCLAFRTSTQQ